MKAQEIEAPGGTRTILVDTKGQPVLIEMAAREATTASGRMKVVFYAPDDGDGLPVALPFSQAVIGTKRKPHGYTPEFRLEMN